MQPREVENLAAQHWSKRTIKSKRSEKSETKSGRPNECGNSVFKPPKNFYLAFYSLSLLASAAALSSTTVSIALAVKNHNCPSKAL
jgi:hypothetical protein